MLTVILVEGTSDRVALEELARMTGTALPRVIELGGATNATTIARRFPDTRMLALGDVKERRFFERAGIRPEDLFLCDRDLEEELIRALGVEATEAVIAAQGDRRQLETLKKQPNHRDDEPVALLRRFMGTTSGRKAKYGVALVEALDPANAPAPLLGLLRAVSESPGE